MIANRTALLLFTLALLSTSALAASGQALLDAIADRQAQRVAILLDQGVSPETTSDSSEYKGKSALMWAAETGQSEIIGLLLQYGAQVDRNNAKGGTALMYAAVNGHADAIRALVDGGADPDHQVRHGWTPLLLATAKGHVDCVTTLAELGADLDTRDVYGWTLLMHATDREDVAMVEALLALGLAPEATDTNGISAAALARRKNRDDLTTLLEDAAANAR